MSGTTADNGGGTVRYSVPQAARYLGISERAVRKRITAGSLSAERDGRQWVVFLPAVPDAVPSGTEGGTGSDDGAVPTEPIDVDYRVAPAARQQLEAIRDEWLAPLVAQIADQAETIGRLTAERDEERRRREALESRLSELEATTVVQGGSTVVEAPAATDAARAASWWQFWKR